MMGKMHYIGGIGAGVATVYYLGGELPSAYPLIAGAVLGAIGGLAPDIDLESSRISMHFWRTSKLFQKFGHRGYTHTLLALFLLISPVFLLRVYTDCPVVWISALLAFSSGYFMHLVQDTFTMMGVPWLKPLRNSKIKLAGFVAGNKLEGAITFILITLYAYGLDELVASGFAL